MRKITESTDNTMRHCREYMGYYFEIQESDENGFDFNISKTDSFEDPIDGGVDQNYTSAVNSAKSMIERLMMANIDISLEQMTSIFNRGSIFIIDDMIHRHININENNDLLIEMYWSDDDNIGQSLIVEKTEVLSIHYNPKFEEYVIETELDIFNVSVLNLDPVLPLFDKVVK